MPRRSELLTRLLVRPLVQRLLEDIEQGGGSDALPLLAFTLEQLYLEYGGGGTLKLADYKAFGGIKGAIEAAVGRALAAADADPRIPRDREARGYGRPGLIDYLTFLQIWTIPPSVRHSLRDKIVGRRSAQESNDSAPVNAA